MTFRLHLRRPITAAFARLVPKGIVLALSVVAVVAAAPRPAAAQDDAAAMASDARSGRAGRIRKLQIMSRVYQICYGRTLRKDEAKRVLPMNQQEIVAYILGSDELAAVYGGRLAAFATAGDGANYGAPAAVPDAVQRVARPEATLEAVLKSLAQDRHKGASCGAKPAGVCFARWLVDRIAPSLGPDWVARNEAAIGGWTYAKLLEQISLTGLGGFSP